MSEENDITRSTHPGALAVRRARLAARLTQEQLAVAAGVHIRTIRGLESASITKPRWDTLNRIAGALQLYSDARQDLLQRWHVEETALRVDPASVFGVDKPRDNTASLGTITQNSIESIAVIIASDAVLVGSDLNPRSTSSHEVLSANAEVVTRRYLIFRPDFDASDPDFYVDSLENCSVHAEHLFPDQGVKVFELKLADPLLRGATAVIRYRVNYPQPGAGERAVIGKGNAQRILRGFYKPIGTYVLEVRFQPGSVPSCCEQLYQLRPSAPLEVKRSISINSNNVSHIVLSNRPPGGHGIQW